MLIIVNESCCQREPFENHKENCYFKRQKKEMDKCIQNLIKHFRQALKGGD